MGRFRSLSSLHLTWGCSLLAAFFVGMINKDCSKVNISRFTPDKKHAPVNIVVPLHLSHYDIIRSILSNSHVEKEIYIHDDADLISTSWAIKEFNRCYSSQKENKRLIQAGIPKVMSGDIHRHTVLGYQNERSSALTRHPGITSFIKSAQKMTLIENTEYDDDYYEDQDEDEEEKETPSDKREKALRPIRKQMQSGLLILFERWSNVTEEVQMIMTFQNPLDWASEAFYDSDENENSELERDPEIIFKTYLKLMQYFFEACHRINKKHGKKCFWSRIEDIMSNPSDVFHVKNLHPYEKMRKYLKQMSKKRETLLENMEDGELAEYREIWGSDPSLQNLGYDSGEAKKLKKTDDLYIFF